MKSSFCFSIITCLFLTNCISKVEMVDSILFDKTKDNPNFKTCNEYIYQYFNDSKGLSYKGEKPALVRSFFNQYNTEMVDKESGLIRIRFVVNCKGETDRYRLIGIDNNYNEKIFDKKITDQLLNITKKLNGWEVKKIEGKAVDYYQYIIFVIKDGEITKILP